MTGDIVGMTYDEAVAAVVAPGGRYEIVEVDIPDGQGGTRREPVFLHTPESLRELFAGARGRGDQVFLVYEDERWTFTEVAARSDAIGAVLVERYGVQPGDRVAIAMRNYPEWVMAFIAITSIGAVVVPLNAWWTTEELAYGLTDSGAAVLLADRERIDRVAPVLGDLGVAWWRFAPTVSCRLVSIDSTMSSSMEPRCLRSTSAPTTTPRSSTPPAPPAIRKARCRPIGPCSVR